MKKYDTCKQAVLTLRYQGYSLNMLQEKYSHIPRRTICSWIENIPFCGKRNTTAIKAMAQSNKQRSLIKRQTQRDAGKLYAQQHHNDFDLVTVCALYWAEGGKSRNAFSFSNCDPNMHLIIRNFLKKKFPYIIPHISLQIQIHNIDQLSHAKQFWSNLFEDNIDFDYVYLITSQTTRKTKWPYGILSQRIYKTEIVQFFFGAISELYHIDNNFWENKIKQ